MNQLKKVFWYGLFSLFLIFFDTTIGFGSLKSHVSKSLNPLQVGFWRGGMTVRESLDFFFSLPSIYQENLNLREEIILLTEEKQEMMEQISQYDLFLGQVQDSFWDEMPLVMLKVLGFYYEGDERFLLISGEELSEGQTVFWNRFLVGEVAEVRGNVSLVRTIFSPKSKVSVWVDNGESLIQGLVESNFSKELILDNVLIEEKICSGDMVLTSGLSSRYLKNLIVGRVGQVFENSGELYQSARLEVLYSLENLDFVFVVDNL